MSDFILNILGSDILHRIMVFIWMMIITLWMRKIGKEIIEFYTDIRVLTAINEEQWKAIQKLGNESRCKKDE